MEKPDPVTYMMSFIKDFDYPLIHSMHAEEMADVFHVKNRCFLVSWVLTLLDEECYGPILEGREQDKTLLADLVCCHGFCTETEKVGFLNGDLPVGEQVRILHKIFKFIERQKKVEKLTDIQPVKLEEIYTLRNTDLNLFPALGEVKSLTEEERKLKTEELKFKIEEIISKQGKIKELGDSDNVSKVNKEDIKAVINNIRENLSQFDRVVKVISKEASSKVEPKYKINPASSELLASCNKNLKTITQYIEDLKTINEFEPRDIQVPVDEITPLIEILAEQIQSSGL